MIRKKAILCYGDSLSWGANPDNRFPRHAASDRWPGVLAAGLGDGVRVVSEALPGRTTIYDDPTSDDNRNGASMLGALLTSHDPVDLVIIMLGTNDIKYHISGGRVGAAVLGLRQLVRLIRNHEVPGGEKPSLQPDIFIVAPPPLVPSDDAAMRIQFQGLIDESKKFASLYQSLADEMGCHFFDAGLFAHTSPVDGVHLDVENTRAIGYALVDLVKNALDRK